MARTRMNKWCITIKDPPDGTHMMRDIRRSYRTMRTSGMSQSDARYLTLTLLICGGSVHVKPERIR